jgi:hypothetical protein
MQELNVMEVNEVSGARMQVTGFLYYLLSGGDIIFKEDDGSTRVY